MAENSTAILCDGCGAPASPEHIAARMQRLELVTKFRPIHIHVLFVALAPMPRPEDDFYGPPESRDFFDALLSELNISSSAEKIRAEPIGLKSDAEKLLEFQRRGYYLTYLSECPLPSQFPAGVASNQENQSVAREYISRLAHTLIKRIRFNYKPKHVALLGTNLTPLIPFFEQAGIAPLLLLNHGAPLTLPGLGLHSALIITGQAKSLP